MIEQNLTNINILFFSNPPMKCGNLWQQCKGINQCMKIFKEKSFLEYLETYMVCKNLKSVHKCDCQINVCVAELFIYLFFKSSMKFTIWGEQLYYSHSKNICYMYNTMLSIWALTVPRYSKLINTNITRNRLNLYLFYWEKPIQIQTQTSHILEQMSPHIRWSNLKETRK